MDTQRLRSIIWIALIVVLAIILIVTTKRGQMPAAPSPSASEVAPAPVVPEAETESWYASLRDTQKVVTVVNQRTQASKSFSGAELINGEFIDSFDVDGEYLPFTLEGNFLTWSTDGKDYWGFVAVYSGADPPVNEAVMLYKIDTDTWHIDKYVIPGRLVPMLTKQNLNLDRNEVVLESFSARNDLEIYRYNFITRSRSLVAMYPANLVAKYLGSEHPYLEYYYPISFGVDSRALHPRWIDANTIAYEDLVTRKTITVK